MAKANRTKPGRWSEQYAGIDASIPRVLLTGTRLKTPSHRIQFAGPSRNVYAVWRLPGEKRPEQSIWIGVFVQSAAKRATVSFSFALSRSLSTREKKKKKKNRKENANVPRKKEVRKDFEILPALLLAREVSLIFSHRLNSINSCLIISEIFRQQLLQIPQSWKLNSSRRFARDSNRSFSPRRASPRLSTYFSLNLA